MTPSSSFFLKVLEGKQTNNNNSNINNKSWFGSLIRCIYSPHKLVIRIIHNLFFCCTIRKLLFCVFKRNQLLKGTNKPSCNRGTSVQREIPLLVGGHWALLDQDHHGDNMRRIVWEEKVVNPKGALSMMVDWSRFKDRDESQRLWSPEWPSNRHSQWLQGS